LGGDGIMSIDLFRRVSKRNSEFKGRNSDTDKYFRKNSFKSDVVTIGIVLLFVIGLFYFMLR